jgi:membrane-bound lytic murein transglycosylase D
MRRKFLSFQMKKHLAQGFTGLLAFVACLPVSFSAEPLPDSTFSYQTPAFVRQDALHDPGNKIDSAFKIPAALFKRTAFWFDIYTQYGENDFIIHDVRYPWIIFKVVNISDIMNSNLPKWTKFHKAEAYVHNQVKLVRQHLATLARQRELSYPTESQRDIIAQYSEIKMPLRKILRAAAGNVRVQLGQKDFFTAGLLYSDAYLPIMEQEFSARGLPTELTRLPFVESSFNVKAESKVGASGIWQIMPYTGRRYLTINNIIDERNSPLKATLVAAELFKQNFHEFKSWPLAITAYNHGGSGLETARKKLHSSDLAKIIERYHSKSFKFASANFYTCFLAALHAQKYHDEIFPTLALDQHSELEYHVASLEHSEKIQNLMHTLHLSREDLLIYNLDLREAIRMNAKLPRGYSLILPVTKEAKIMREFESKHRTVREASLRLRSNTSS